MDRSLLLLISVFALGLAMLISPGRLASVGIMDISLSSDNQLTRETAFLTIRVARIGLAALGAIFGALALFSPKIRASHWFERRVREGSVFPVGYEQQQRRLFKPTAYFAFASLFVASLYLALGARIEDTQMLRWINREDGLLEWISALMLLVASGLALYAAIHIPVRAQRMMHILLAVVFFVMFGEEISWGQRVFGLSTPEFLTEVNVQNEINLHNNFGYVFDHLFILCFFLWGCVVPFLYQVDPIWRWYQSRLGLPYPSVGLALAMLAVTLCQPQLTDPLLGVVPWLRVAELRETLSAFCLLLLMLESRALTTPYLERNT